MSWTIASKTLQSRLLLGTAQYPSPDIMRQAIQAAGAEVITVSLRRQSSQAQQQNTFWEFIQDLDCHILPNTAGCRTAKEAITTAQMAREIFKTDWIKLEVIGDNYSLQPDPFELVIATEALIKQGFKVFPYCTDDLVLCNKLVELGCDILMPWAAPIGTAQGILNPFALRSLRQRFPNLQLIVDAGLGAPSHATEAMELGYDGVLINSAVALAQDPIKMAQGFGLAVQAGRLAYLAKPMPPRDMARPSTPVVGQPFWQTSVATQAINLTPPEFPSCGPQPLGFYPIVDNVDTLARLLPLGVNSIQLRIKNKTGGALEEEIARAVRMAQDYSVRLFINDYWQLAIKYGAYGVHLGQEDLVQADYAAIQQAGLRLGLSSHNAAEVVRARAMRPSYLAFGPVYPTTSKVMSFAPQGLASLRHCVETVPDCPWVAIGGVNLARLPDVLAMGVNGVAVISALQQTSDLENTVKTWLQACQI